MANSAADIIRKGASDILILMLLSEKERNGYEILKEIEQRIRGLFSLSESALYIFLYRYVITTIYQEGERSRGTTSGSKTASYVNSSNVMVWSVSVYGEFSYTGYSSSAASASGNVTLYGTGASLASNQSFTSGSRAVAKATVPICGG